MQLRRTDFSSGRTQQREKATLCGTTVIPWANQFAMAHKFVFCLLLPSNLPNEHRLHSHFFFCSSTSVVHFIYLAANHNPCQCWWADWYCVSFMNAGGAALICEAIAESWVDIIARKNRWSQIQGNQQQTQAIRCGFGIMHYESHTHTHCAARITNFEYVNKFSVYDTRHNVFQLSALTMLSDGSDGHRQYLSIVHVHVFDSLRCLVSRRCYVSRLCCAQHRCPNRMQCQPRVWFLSFAKWANGYLCSQLVMAFFPFTWLASRCVALPSWHGSNYFISRTGLRWPTKIFSFN